MATKNDDLDVTGLIGSYNKNVTGHLQKMLHQPLLDYNSLLEVTRFSGFGQVKIAGKSELEINKITERKENMICVRKMIAEPKGSA